MHQQKRKALEAARFRVGDAADFLGLTDAERRLVELRLKASRLVRQKRQEAHLSQKQLAARLKSSQSRVAKVEAGAMDVSLDLMLRALFEAGGGLEDLTKRQSSKRIKAGRRKT
jgi:ribosome-binding protein aMBF1 (putative translation factor)